MQLNRLLMAALALVFPAAVFAHPGHEASGFLHGFTHPVGGLDHVLAMVAVGLWAAQIGGKAIYAVPAAFVGFMVLGGAMGVAGLGLPFVEAGIMASVLVLGLLVAASLRLPLYASVLLVGGFSLFHGYAHGAEMPADASAATYALGFALATALLHLGGVALGMAVSKANLPLVNRVAGGAIAFTGLYMAF